MEQLTLFDLSDLRPLLAGKRFLLVHGPFFDSLPIAPFFSALDAVPFTGFTPNPKTAARPLWPWAAAAPWTWPSASSSFAAWIPRSII